MHLSLTKLEKHVFGWYSPRRDVIQINLKEIWDAICKKTITTKIREKKFVKWYTTTLAHENVHRQIQKAEDAEEENWYEFFRTVVVERSEDDDLSHLGPGITREIHEEETVREITGK